MFGIFCPFELSYLNILIALLTYIEHFQENAKLNEIDEYLSDKRQLPLPLPFPFSIVWLTNETLPHDQCQLNLNQFANMMQERER